MSQCLVSLGSSPCTSKQYRKMQELQKFINEPVLLLTNDGRIIVGILEGFDQTTNVILSSAHERIFSEHSGVEVAQLGLYLVRGDNIALVGDLDENVEGEVDYENLRAAPIRPIVH